MKVSHKWLQQYFKEEIPSPEKLAELFTFHSFEIEGIEKKGSDSVVDAKILPDRAHYALSHHGIAEEVAVVSNLNLSERQVPQITPTSSYKLDIKVQDDNFCPRYIGRIIEDVTVRDSQAVTSELLEAVGGRAINSVVDATNFVMYDLGQPLHAFDADEVKGSIVVRAAEKDEKITTLDGKEVTLTKDDFVIADDIGPLAIAGVKGGKRAEVTKKTKNIILESANFNAVSVRKTSTRVGIRNESSKRFENAITPELAKKAMDQVTTMILETSPQSKAGDIVDVYPSPVRPHTISTTATFISESLGVEIPLDSIVSILKRMSIGVEVNGDGLSLTIPTHRLDLVIAQDIVEEVGRIFGYEKVQSKLPPQTSNRHFINKQFYYTEKIKDMLVNLGFSETYLYTLVPKGHFEVVYPLASDKGFLRTDLTQGIAKTLELNAQNAPLLGISKIKIFEVGTVFKESGEYTSLAIGVKHTVKKKGETADTDVQKALEELEKALSINLNIVQLLVKNGVAEINLTELIKQLPEPTKAPVFDTLKDGTYKPFSVYPFSLRDIAVFVPDTVAKDEVAKVIFKNAGELLVRLDLFDVFTKKFEDGTVKTSYAYHLVFQSFERTLTENDVNPVMEGIYKEMAEKGWQVR